MNEWHNLCVTDKSGKHFFNVTASPMSTWSEIKNLKKHIESARLNPSAYSFLDAATAIILLDGTPYESVSEVDADELLRELGL